VNSNQEEYGYDDLKRLTSANGPWGTLSYTYEGNHDLDNKQVFRIDAATFSPVVHDPDAVSVGYARGT